MAEEGNFAVDWQSNPEWRTGRITPANLKEMKWLWFVTLFANLNVQISWPEVIRLITEQGNWGKGLLLSLFPLGGLWLLWFTIRRHFKTRAIAASLLNLPTCPGIIGAQFKGMIELPPTFPRGRQFAVTLSCRKATRARRRFSEEELWSEKQVVLAVPGPRGAQLPFAFVVPKELPHSSNMSFDVFYRWLVDVSVMSDTDTLEISFLVPLLPARASVPATAASSNGAAIPPPLPTSSVTTSTPAPSPPSPAASSGALADLLRQVAIAATAIEARGDRLLFQYSSKRFVIGGVISLICAVFAFLFALSIYTDHGLSAGRDTFTSIFPAGVGVLFLLGALAFLGDSLTVEAGPTEIEVVRRLFSIRTKHYRVPVSALKGVNIKGAGQAGVGSSTTFYYSVVLQLKNGGRITVGDGIKGQANARLIARIFELKYGFQQTSVRAEPMVSPA